MLITVSAISYCVNSGASPLGPPAGVLGFACKDQIAHYLLAFDPAPRRRAWGHLGGQAEAGESPTQTALREFHEESNCAFRSAGITLDQLQGPSIWPSNRFHTYLLRLPFTPAVEIQAPRSCANVERSDWVWIRHDALHRSLKVDGLRVKVASGTPRDISLWSPARRSLLQAVDDGVFPVADPCK